MSDLPRPIAAVPPDTDHHRSTIQRLQAVMDQAPFPMALFVGDRLRVPAHNEHMREIWSKTAEEIGEHPLLAFLPEIVGQGFDDLLYGVMRTGESHEGKEVLARFLRGGELVDLYFNFIYSLYRDEAGRPLGVLSVATEVTALVRGRQEIERQVAERTAELTRTQSLLKARHTELQRTFEQAPVGIFVTKGKDHVYELLNPMFCEVLGLEAEKCIGKTVAEVFPELIEQGFDQLLAQIMRTGEALVFNDTPVKILNGGTEETRYFTFSYQPYRDETQAVIGVTGVGVEVTEQHLATEKVAASEREVRTILGSMPNMVWTHLPDGRGNFFSERWCEYTGVAVGDMTTFDWAPLIHPDDFVGANSVYARSLATGLPYSHEHRIRRADGTWRWHLNRAVPLRDGDGDAGDGAIRLWVGTATDIHELRDAETKLLRLSEQVQDTNEVLNVRNRELARTNRALTLTNADMDNFVYTASHDLKAPITNIQGLHRLLREELAGAGAGAQVEPILDMMDRSLERFMRTVRELGDIASLQRDEEAAPQSSSLAEVLDEVLLEYAAEVRASGATVTRELGLGGCPIPVSHKNLRSVVYNLISNALKYRSPDRPPEVRVACTREGGRQVLSVSDNGLGMDLSGDHKLFSMFYRMHDHVEGSGVGLHIVKKIVDNLDGRIEVDSALGVGTTFRVYFKTHDA